jgi:hypothetical protein
VVKTATWAAAEEAVRLGEVQQVLGDGFVVSVDRDTAVLEVCARTSRPTPGWSAQARRRCSPASSTMPWPATPWFSAR